MSHLYPHLRVHQIFGANTDVGKTIFTTALCIASARLPYRDDLLAGSSSSSGPVTSSLRHQQEQHEADVREALAGKTNVAGEQVHYVKPVSTGPMSDSDDSHIARFASPTTEKTLLRFSDAVSPHLAARLSKPSVSPIPDLNRIPTDSELTCSIGNWISQKASTSSSGFGGKQGVAYVETAGGPHSPSPSGTSQLHLLRPLRLPTILIGDSNLGGISTTKSAYESLLIAGHQIDALLLFTEGKNDKWGNADYLIQWGQEIGLPVWGVAGLRDAQGSSWGGPPERVGSKEEDALRMKEFYRGLVFGRNRITDDPEQVGGVIDVVRHLRRAHHLRLQELDTMASRARESYWWPFTQHGLVKEEKDVAVIDSAYGDSFSAFRQRTEGTPTDASSRLYNLFDGSASWWTQCLGHAHPALAQAAAQAAGRYGHVLFPSAANEPSLKLAETLLGRRDRSPIIQQDTAAGGSELHGASRVAPGAGWADRVFYSDDGSTAMEVALKMAIASSRQRYAPQALTDQSAERVSAGRKAGSQGGRPPREWKILGLKGSYHGDTIGAMDACEPSVYSKQVDWYKGKGCWIDPPSVGLFKGDQATVRIPSDADTFGEAAGKEVHYPSLQAIYNIPERLASDPLAESYRQLIRAWLEKLVLVDGERLGALVIEPIILGAGGMVFADPLFQRVLVDVVRSSGDLFGLVDPPSRDAHAPLSVELQAELDAASAQPSLRGERTWSGLPVIYDEVFVGLYRLGHSAPGSTLLGVDPDISCLAKILTGGVVPLSVTLASRSIFETFNKGTERKVDALLHGHSYTAHPVGCQVANETLAILGSMEARGAWEEDKKQWAASVPSSSTNATSTTKTTTTVAASSESPQIYSLWSRSVLSRLSNSSKVEWTMALGTVLVISLTSASGTGGYTSTASVEVLRRLRQGVDVKSSEGGEENEELRIHARPLGNVIYVMASLNTSKEARRKVEEALCKELGVGVGVGI